MFGWNSLAATNDELVDNLVNTAFIRSTAVQRAFRAVDRAHYYISNQRQHAYKIIMGRIENVGLFPPTTYAVIMEALELKPGLSFLNLGSGSGYLSTIVGLLLGHRGINHGIELEESIVTDANDKLEHFLKNCQLIDEFDFCEPVFTVGNCLTLAESRKYDRVFCGAACPEEYESYIKDLVKVRGILVMPFRGRFVKFVKVNEKTWTDVGFAPVSCSPFINPPLAEKDKPVKHAKLSDTSPLTLQQLCRFIIRSKVVQNVNIEYPKLQLSLTLNVIEPSLMYNLDHIHQISPIINPEFADASLNRGILHLLNRMTYIMHHISSLGRALASNHDFTSSEPSTSRNVVSNQDFSSSEPSTSRNVISNHNFSSIEPTTSRNVTDSEKCSSCSKGRDVILDQNISSSESDQEEDSESDDESLTRKKYSSADNKNTSIKRKYSESSSQDEETDFETDLECTSAQSSETAIENHLKTRFINLVNNTTEKLGKFKTDVNSELCSKDAFSENKSVSVQDLKQFLSRSTEYFSSFEPTTSRNVTEAEKNSSCSKGSDCILEQKINSSDSDEEKEIKIDDKSLMGKKCSSVSSNKLGKSNRSHSYSDKFKNMKDFLILRPIHTAECFDKSNSNLDSKLEGIVCSEKTGSDSDSINNVNSTNNKITPVKRKYSESSPHEEETIFETNTELLECTSAQPSETTEENYLETTLVKRVNHAAKLNNTAKKIKTDINSALYSTTTSSAIKPFPVEELKNFPNHSTGYIQGDILTEPATSNQIGGDEINKTNMLCFENNDSDIKKETDGNMSIETKLVSSNHCESLLSNKQSEIKSDIHHSSVNIENHTPYKKHCTGNISSSIQQSTSNEEDGTKMSCTLILPTCKIPASGEKYCTDIIPSSLQFSEENRLRYEWEYLKILKEHFKDCKSLNKKEQFVHYEMQFLKLRDALACEKKFLKRDMDDLRSLRLRVEENERHIKYQERLRKLITLHNKKYHSKNIDSSENPRQFPLSMAGNLALPDPFDDESQLSKKEEYVAERSLQIKIIEETFAEEREDYRFYIVQKIKSLPLPPVLLNYLNYM